MREAQAAEVRGTPTIFVNGKRVQNRSVEGFQQMIDAAKKGWESGSRCAVAAGEPPPHRARMHRRIACSVALLGAVACATVPYTNRSQLVLISQSEEAELGAQAFVEATANQRVVRGTPAARQVEDVGRRIAAVAGRNDFQWQFTLLEGKEVNAFALPGGKAAVYTGLLPVAHDTSGLAVVMSHEIAHAVARHGAEVW